MKPILLADDDNTFQMLLQRACKSQGLVQSITLCRSGAEVRQAFGEGAPRCAVLDLNLGDEDGLELAAWILQGFPDTAVLVQTWGMQPDTQERGAALGVEVREKERSYERLCAFLQDLGGRYPKPVE